MKPPRLVVTKAPVEVRHAVVTAGHPLGAAVGAEILRRGGNAVDAAVATAFAMAVVEPFMSCLAGGGSLLIHRPRRGAPVALDLNREAPAPDPPGPAAARGSRSTSTARPLPRPTPGCTGSARGGGATSFPGAPSRATPTPTATAR